MVIEFTLSSLNYRTSDDYILFDEINDKKIYWEYI